MNSLRCERIIFLRIASRDATAIPSHPPSALTPQQRSAHDEACKLLDLAYGLSGSKFIYIDSSGALIGDFARLVYTPALMIPFIRFAIDLAKMPGFPGIAREVVILLSGHCYSSPFVLYSHQSQAATSGLPEPQIKALSKGEKPSGRDDLDEECEVAYDAAVEVWGVEGRMSDVMFGRAEKVFGKEGTAALT